MEQKVTDKYAVYNGDCLEVLPTLRDDSIHLSVYSPPFCGLYQYSSSDRDFSNCRSYEEFFEQYELLVREIYRVTMPGRMTCVHCMDVPSGNTGCDSYTDFPGDIIRLHEKCGFRMASPRVVIWKEPLAVRNRTLTKALAHQSVVEDSCDCTVAGGDYLLTFRKRGANPVPVTHAHGLMRYAGERKVPNELLRYRGWAGKQTENRYSHWIWRQYASCIWDDIRGNTGKKADPKDPRSEGVLPYRESRDQEDEKHVHPLQLDVYERTIEMRTNPGEKVLEPFMGVGSGIYTAVITGRLGVGMELKPSYYRQSIKNLETANYEPAEGEQSQFEFAGETAEETA
jgi:DNA modification methylase